MSKTNQVFVSILWLAIFSTLGYTQKVPKVDFAKKIKEATPQSLPQTPDAKRLTSDAQDYSLKGKVKTLVEEREGLTGIEKPIGKRLSLIADFDEQGSRLKEVYFEYRGRPYYVTVYGYIDGARVSNSTSIIFDDTLRLGGTPIGGTPKPKKEETTKPDSRYNLKYVYKYENGKLAEMQMFNNNGSKGNRVVYKYKQNQMEKLTYTEDDELNSKYLYILDKNGNESGRIDFNVREPQIPEINKWQYQNVIFDEKGNWTKRTFATLEVENGKEVYKPIAIEYRTITYLDFIQFK